MAEVEDKQIMVTDITDRNGNVINIFSTDGKPKSAAEFASALRQYNDTNGATIPDGFDIKPPGFFSTVRKSFEAVNQPVQQNTPVVGRAIGSIAASSPLLVLGRAAGIIPERSLPNVPTVAGNIGESTARFGAEQVNTIPKVGAAIGTGLAAKAALPVVSATGQVMKAPFLANMATAGAGGAAGLTAGMLTSGEAINPGKIAVEFGIDALGGGLASVISAVATKFMTGDIAERTTKQIVDKLVERYPTLANNKNFIDMAASSPAQIENIAQQLSEGLRGTVDDLTTTLGNDIKLTLPTALSKGQQNTFRAHIRSVIEAQSDLLDAQMKTGEITPALVQKATDRLNSMYQFIRDAYPGIKNINPTTIRIEEILNKYKITNDNIQQGAKVIAALRRSGANEGWSPIKFAQEIRGTYQEPGNPLMTEIGNILSGGRPLTQMPTVGAADPQGELLRRGYNSIKDFIPGVGKYLPSANYKGPSTPWPTPASPLTPLTNFAIQEAGQGAIKQPFGTVDEQAIKSFLNRRGKK